MGDEGPVLTYARALRTRRIVWFSEAFQASHPNLMNIVHVRRTATGVKWKIIADRSEFVEVLNKRRDAGRGSTETLAFVASPEASAVELGQAKRLTAASAPNFLAVLRRNTCSMGVCKT